MPVMSFVSAVFILGNEMVGLVTPGATVNMYGQMKIDINQTRSVVEKVIPPKTISNTTRYNTIMLQFENVMKAVDDYNTTFVKDGKEIITLYVKHESKPEDFQKVFSSMDSAREAEMKKVMEARFKIKGVVTKEEWKAIFSPQSNTKG
jgi:hypothetical protein